jgi:N-acetylneuraminic acid mutarotase
MGNETSSTAGGGDAVERTVRWTKKVTGGGLKPSARDGHVFVSAAGSTLGYLFGGMTQELVEANDLFEFNSETNEWSEIVKTEGAAWPAPRANATAAVVGGKLYLFGGMNGDTGGWLGDLWVFDLATKVWAELTSVVGALPSARDKLTSTVIGNQIVFFGGFGPTALEANAEEDEDEPAVAGVAVDADADVADADQGAYASWTWFNDVFVLNTDTLECKLVVPVGFGPSPRAAHAMCTVGANAAIFGGRDTVGRTNDLYFLIPNSTSWSWSKPSATGDAPAPVSFHSITALDGNVVVVGGRNAANDHVSAVHAFDVPTGQWSHPDFDVGSEVHKRGNYAVCSLGADGKQVVAFGGSSMYDPETQCCQTFYSDTCDLTLAAKPVAPATITAATPISATTPTATATDTDAPATATPGAAAEVGATASKKRPLEVQAVVGAEETPSKVETITQPAKLVKF